VRMGWRVLTLVSSFILHPSGCMVVQGVAGGRVDLPCNTSWPGGSSPPTLVMWFKDGSPDPIYSYDARPPVAPGAGGQHWAEKGLQGRLAFTLRDSPSTSSLTLLHLEEQDAGQYRCRVDYRAAPTSQSKVTLQTVVPPGAPHLTMGGERVGGVLGPLYQGEEVQVHCTVQGGTPPPTLAWRVNGLIVKEKKTESEDEKEEEVVEGGDEAKESVVESLLSLPSLTRADNNMSITCTSSNSPLSPPKRVSTTLMLHCNHPSHYHFPCASPFPPLL